MDKSPKSTPKPKQKKSVTETNKDGNLEKELPMGKSVNKVFNNKVKKAAPKMF